MGVMNRGILGGFKNKVGDVVGTSWKGRAVIKSRPLSVANPNTTGQQTARGKFKFTSQFFAPIVSQIVIPFWNRFSGNISGFNAICQANIAFISSVGVVTYASIVMSKGKMVAPTITSVVSSDAANTIVTTVATPVDATWGMNGETVAVACYNETKAYWVTGTNTGNPNSSVVVTIADTKFVSGDVFAVFVMLRRPDGTQVSNNAYVAHTATT